MNYCSGTEDAHHHRESVVDNLLVAMLIAQDVVSRDVNSARPDAPVVPHVAPARRRSRTFRTRAALAGVLHRAADVAAPAECSPATH
jgi:hypothetical protein